MKLDRRDCLRLGAAAGAGMALAGCSRILRGYTAPEPPRSISLPRTGEVEPVARLLNRAAFGPTPGEVERIASMGLANYVEEQLNPAGEESKTLAWRLAPLEAIQIEAAELRDQPEQEVIRQLQQSVILRAVYSRYPLRERMVDFWSNHFNIYARKGFGAWLKPTDEVNVIRQHALGKFPDLLRASAHSPAMLAYLDNQVNRKRDAKGAGANENYARELMELHTLGVRGGYTQKDVQEVARCFTGWTIEDRFLKPRGRFRFDPERHDDGPKTVLGAQIPPGGGQEDGERVLEILAAHPGTARFIAQKLCRYFLGDTNSPMADTLADIYRKTDGDIKAMLRPLLLSDALRHAPPIMKRPFDFVVSALRALNADTDGGKPLQERLAQMGQPLYQWPMPDGYPDRTSAWTGSLLARWNFAFALMSGAIGGTGVDISGLMRLSDATTDDETAAALTELILARRADSEAVRPVRDRIRAHFQNAPRWNRPPLPLLAEATALLLASPEFQWR